MIIYKNLKDVQAESIKDVTMTIGNFDGVHLGHQKLFHEVLKSGEKSAVITFDPLPEKVLTTHPPPRLFSLDEQVGELEKLKFDIVLIAPFTLQMSQLSAEDFAKIYIFDLFHPAHLTVGYDFVFGHGRKGNASLLQKMCERFNCQFKQIEALEIDGQIVSSSLIRKYIQEGKLQLAHKFLGRPFFLSGVIINGKKIGRQLGFPTANMNYQGEILPGHGVYVCRTYYANNWVYGVCNIGLNPTVNASSQETKVECHFFDFNSDLYGEVIKVEILQKIRDELKFNGLEDLKKQIQLDCAKAKGLIATHTWT